MDATYFSEQLDKLRSHILQGHKIAYKTLSGNSLGYVTTKPGIDGSSPYLSLRAHLDTSSQHTKLTTHAWWQEALETFLHLECEMRTIPALSHPDIHWGISFMRPSPSAKIQLPPYRINIMGAYLTTGYVKTAKVGIAKLQEIENLLAAVPAAKPTRRFRVDDKDWPAASPEALARIWAAVNDPKMLSKNPGPVSLPEIVEIHDRSALCRSLQEPFGPPL
jgi:hypothetical protein